MKKIFQNKKIIISLLIVICLVGGGIFTYNNLKPDKKAQRVADNYFKQLKNNKVPNETCEDFSQLKNLKIIDYKCANVTDYGNTKERQLFYNFIVEDNLIGKKAMKIIVVTEPKNAFNYKITAIAEDTR